ncbi:hypothetical protein [Microbacterium lacticum]|uniref:YobI family P-loop NTPase n=1 Tax=Microbacterium lacticum TaxID=33885 RepID=UPI0024323FC5|nr:hypothetical protein [Microbacterium lacticum]
MTDTSERATRPLKLESLVPRFVSDQHGTYRDELVDLLTDDGRRARVWNIALTGGYGSGKSSVLAGVRDQLGQRVVEISLSSLSDVGVESGDDLNNYIQKEIVKQLLYRERPSRVPGSRFKRISRLPVGRTLLASALASARCAGVQFFYPERDLVFEDIEVDDALVDASWCESVRILGQLGMEARLPPRGFLARLACAVVVADTPAMLTEHLNAAARGVRPVGQWL